MQQPSVIFLDAVGTLFTVEGSVGQVYSQLTRQFGIEADPHTLNKAFFQAFTTATPMAFPNASVDQIPQLEYQWWETLAVETFKIAGIYQQFADFSQFFAQLYDHFATEKPWFVYPDVPPILEKWQNQGIELGVVSNFDSRLIPVLEVLNLAPFFQSVTISTLVGAAKPNPEIFYTALEKHHCSPEQVLHIGDSVSADYHGAKQAGIQAMIVNREADETVRSRLSLPEIEFCTTLTEIRFN
ncbi:MAG: HAD family hydrolase [Microcoleaceae cyanobacterium]